MNSSRTKPYIIAVTGTKGKTTIVRLLGHVLTSAGHFTLRVDTDGHYVNEKQRSDMLDSMALYSVGPAVCPGKYLYELRNQLNGVAILEEVFACFTSGTGYRRHHIGIFTNVFEDHIGLRIKTRAQLAYEKANFIFGKITPGGTAIFNADDKLVCQNLTQLKRGPELISRLPVGRKFTHFDLENHLVAGYQAIAIRGSSIGVLTKQGFSKLLEAKDVDWTFKGQYQPSIQNLAFAVAALFTQQKNSFPTAIENTIYNWQPLESGGRLIKLENNVTKVTALLDFAHDKYSLQAIADLARRLSRNKTIGIIRIHPDRTDKTLNDIGTAIANAFDHVIIYDKIDGVDKKVYWDVVRQIEKRAGQTARQLFQAVKAAQTAKHKVNLKIKEEAALKFAFSKAQPGDVVVHIVNDDHKKSLALAKKYLAI